MGAKRYIHEPTPMGPRLGRHVYHDDSSRNWQAELAEKLVSVRHATTGLPLDQGRWGSCTAQATAGCVNTRPNFVYPMTAKTEADAFTLYQLEAKMEGYTTPPADPGGSGLEVCKAAKQLGWISSYTHTFSIGDALLALVKRPVMTGVNWYTSFDSPDENGRVTLGPGATVRGAHEFMVNSMYVPKGATVDDLGAIVVGCTNSWGLAYGLRGRFLMTAATWAQLLSEQGDVTVPVR